MARAIVCVRINSRKRWFEVVAFTEEPREHPRTSSEGEVIAKFRAQGDAALYVNVRLQHPGDFKLFAIR